ncbi:MAG: undecaprenyldiphospho-muramoylpentapeptide beta-N-acetylglucosaminyltransferase [Patescibacteria group bacterium]|nr:undecaprenyldiphospho-muramoylpentapeptide beta-N-acetylglucosaminyltransferase [Patescibacteria group bacterium]
MKVVLTGGGSGGSVAPLLAIAEEIRKRKPETEFLFIGTRKGKPEKEMVQDYHFSFKGIFAGKLRRYFSLRNFLDPLLIFLGFWQALFLLLSFRPKMIISAGGFVAVPVVIAGWFLKIPSLIHQQDIIPSLTNKILIPFAKKITVSFDKSLNDFPKGKTILTGQPIREMIFKGDKEKAIQKFNLEKNLPTLLVLGGGTGAAILNELIWRNLERLTKICQIIHLTGPGKAKIGNWPSKIKNFRYHTYEFLTDEIADAYAVADLVVSRAGINVLSELAVLGKPTIVIPIPNSHQEANAKYFAEKKAVIVLNQKELTDEKLFHEIKKMIDHQEERKNLGERMKEIILKNSREKIFASLIKLGKF